MQTGSKLKFRTASSRPNLYRENKDVVVVVVVVVYFKVY